MTPHGNPMDGTGAEGPRSVPPGILAPGERCWLAVHRGFTKVETLLGVFLLLLLFFLLLPSVVLGVAYFEDPAVASFLILLTLVMIGLVVRRTDTLYAVTDRRVLTVHRLGPATVQEVRLARIVGVFLRSPDTLVFSQTGAVPGTLHSHPPEFLWTTVRDGALLVEKVRGVLGRQGMVDRTDQ